MNYIAQTAYSNPPLSIEHLILLFLLIVFIFIIIKAFKPKTSNKEVITKSENQQMIEELRGIKEQTIKIKWAIRAVGFIIVLVLFGVFAK